MAYTCNGSTNGCDRERFGGCDYCDGTNKVGALTDAILASRGYATPRKGGVMSPLEALVEHGKEKLQSENATLREQLAAKTSDWEYLKTVRDELQAEVSRLMKDRNGWYAVVLECERVVGADGTADSPVTSNLANLIRDVKIERDTARRELAELRKRVERALAVIGTRGIQWQNTLGQVASILNEKGE